MHLVGFVIGILIVCFRLMHDSTVMLDAACSACHHQSVCGAGKQRYQMVDVCVKSAGKGTQLDWLQ
jgi:hypothetical protein